MFPALTSEGLIGVLHSNTTKVFCKAYRKPAKETVNNLMPRISFYLPESPEGNNSTNPKEPLQIFMPAAALFGDSQITPLLCRGLERYQALNSMKNEANCDQSSKAGL